MFVSGNYGSFASLAENIAAELAAIESGRPHVFSSLKGLVAQMDEVCIETPALTPFRKSISVVSGWLDELRTCTLNEQSLARLRTWTCWVRYAVEIHAAGNELSDLSGNMPPGN